MLTSGWLKNIIDRNIADYEKRVRAEERAEILAVLDAALRRHFHLLRLNGQRHTRLGAHFDAELDGLFYVR